VRERLGWSGKFIALYSGNLGLAHDFETLMGAAKRLGSDGIELVFAGEGPRLDEVRRLTAGLPCVSFLPPQPKQNLSVFLAAADVHLVTMRAGLEGLVVPSKAYGAMASRKPLIFVGPAGSEIARVIDETGAGTAVRNGDAEALVSALRKELANKGDSQASGGSAKLSLAMPFSRWRDILK
jgi:glycosyltransferase involved in cell wall biosynthesis